MLSASVLRRPNLTRGATKSSVSRSKFTLPDLPYEYKALEPIISREIMELHHSKHHATYVNNLNAATDKLADAHNKGDVNAIIELQQNIRFNGGGHINHSIFWNNLSPNSSAVSGDLLSCINKDFGSLDEFKSQLTAATVAIQGSGWGWLGYNSKKGCLEIATRPNQDPLQSTAGGTPLLGIDVWEHAYYLQYKNVRADYVKAIWEIVNWDDVASRLATAKQG